MTKLVLRLTRSQHMALLDVLLEHARGEGTQVFVDCSAEEAATTTTADLLLVVMDALRELEVAA